MAAEVSFRFGESGRRRIYISAAAVGEDANGRYVFVVKGTSEGFGEVRRRQVQVGNLGSEGMEVTDGLKEGELVVTAGVTRIEDGQRVRLLGAE